MKFIREVEVPKICYTCKNLELDDISILDEITKKGSRSIIDFIVLKTKEFMYMHSKCKKCKKKVMPFQGCICNSFVLNPCLAPGEMPILSERLKRDEVEKYNEFEDTHFERQDGDEIIEKYLAKEYKEWFKYKNDSLVILYPKKYDKKYTYMISDKIFRWLDCYWCLFSKIQSKHQKPIDLFKIKVAYYAIRRVCNILRFHNNIIDLFEMKNFSVAKRKSMFDLLLIFNNLKENNFADFELALPILKGYSNDVYELMKDYCRLSDRDVLL